MIPLWLRYFPRYTSHYSPMQLGNHRRVIMEAAIVWSAVELLHMVSMTFLYRSSLQLANVRCAALARADSGMESTG